MYDAPGRRRIEALTQGTRQRLPPASEALNSDALLREVAPARAPKAPPDAGFGRSRGDFQTNAFRAEKYYNVLSSHVLTGGDWRV